MFIYEKKLQFPVKISTPNPKLAALIISQYGGPNPNNLPSRPQKNASPVVHIRLRRRRFPA